MSRLSDAIAKAAVDQPEPGKVPVSIGGVLFFVECQRLPGTVWDGIVARSPAQTEAHFRVGYDTGRATALACVEHGRLVGEDGEAESDVDWPAVLDAISGAELRQVSASWWGQNEKDPNSAVAALKKAWAGRDETA